MGRIDRNKRRASVSRLQILVLASFAMAASGCVSFDVSRNKRYHKGYEPGQIYKLTRDLFYMNLAGMAVLDYPDGDAFLPNTISEYNEQPEKWKSIKGIVPKGTKIEIKKLKYYFTIERAKILVYAKVLDGAFKNSIVSINLISGSFIDDITNVPKPLNDMVELLSKK